MNRSSFIETLKMIKLTEFKCLMVHFTQIWAQKKTNKQANRKSFISKMSEKETIRSRNISLSFKNL